MKFLVKQATIVDSGSPHNGKKQDILITDGRIEKIASDIEDAEATLVQATSLHVSPGWVDMQARFGDPGYEYKEDMRTGANAAASGGFTRVCLQSSTLPVMDTGSQVDAAGLKATGVPVYVHAIGALTHANEGKELAELYDMHQAGAIAFSDDKKYIENAKLMELALEYTRNFGGLVVHFADAPALTRQGMMHEGETSVYLGMKGIPEMAEEMGTQRDLYLVKYTGGKLHYNTISTAGATQLIADARKKGLQVTAGVAAHQLYFTDEVVKGFESVHKVIPPYRTQTHVNALIEGIRSGVIETVCSDHTPEDTEHKNLEYEYANPGITNAQTAFSVANTVLRNLISINHLVDLFSTNPRRILGLSQAHITEGEMAELTFFDPDAGFEFTTQMNRSKSANLPFFNVPLHGKVIGIFCKGALHLNGY